MQLLKNIVHILQSKAFPKYKQYIFIIWLNLTFCCCIFDKTVKKAQYFCYTFQYKILTFLSYPFSSKPLWWSSFHLVLLCGAIKIFQISSSSFPGFFSPHGKLCIFWGNVIQTPDWINLSGARDIGITLHLWFRGGFTPASGGFS